jgi:hypothetical protein
MTIRKDAVTLAVASLLASTGFAFADSNASNPTLSIAPDASSIQAIDDATPPTPLMGLLEKTPVGKPMEDLGIKFGGYAEVGYTQAFEHRNGLTIPGRVFDSERYVSGEGGEHVQIDQVDLSVERDIVDRKKFDVGGKIEWSWGMDTYGYHADGLDFYGNHDPGNPEEQFDLTQAYVDINIPVGNGLLIRAGKFITLIGYEYINPTLNPLYSHSFLFANAPFTHTGVLGNYVINDQWQVWGGITRGWDVSTKDNNSAIDGTFQVVYTPNKQWSFTLNGIVGPEDAGDDSHYRAEGDFITTYAATDKLSLGLELLYVWDGAAFIGGFGDESDTAGAAVYASYAFNDYLTFNARGEGVHTSDASLLSPVSTSIYELTLGVTVTPLPKNQYLSSLKIRPEVRWDHSEDPLFRGFTSRDQETFGVDVIYSF